MAVNTVSTGRAHSRLFARAPRLNTLQNITAEELARRLNEVPSLMALDGYARSTNSTSTATGDASAASDCRLGTD